MKGNYNAIKAQHAGSFTVNDTDEKVINFDAIYFPAATVVARIEINGDTGTDVKAAYISTAASAIAAGTYKTALGDDFFSAITLTSGSCELILK